MAFMKREEARKKIDLILENQEPIKTGITLPIRKGYKFNVYQIPLDYLVPNVLNDRIAWRIREWEALKGEKLSVNNEDHVQIVYSFIENESPNENKKTIEDLAEKGQQLDGVITKDGIIIDGNRRATLLRRLFNGEALDFNKSVEDFRFFNAVVLSEDIDEKEIMALETSLQVGEDKKLDYNPICLYIKVDNLLKAGYNHEQIANYMGLKKKNIVEREEIFNLMNEYLRNIGKENHFTLLEHLEDQFINTNIIFKKMDNQKYITYGWDYTEKDVADFKQVCFDYMRAKFEGKKYRDILIGRSTNTSGVFIKKDVWDEFLKNHEKAIENANPQKEQDWQILGNTNFKLNLKNAQTKLNDVLGEKNVSNIVNAILNKITTLNTLLMEGQKLIKEDFENLSDAKEVLIEILKESE